MYHKYIFGISGREEIKSKSLKYLKNISIFFVGSLTDDFYKDPSALMFGAQP